ncbi:unnamed protein product, partial [Staurois parvus]
MDTALMGAMTDGIDGHGQVALMGLTLIITWAHMIISVPDGAVLQIVTVRELREMPITGISLFDMRSAVIGTQ